MVESIRVHICDDQELIRSGLRTLIDLEPTMEVAGESSDGLQAVEQYLVERPDVVLMDLRMPNLGGVEAIRRIKAKHPDARILILTTFDEDNVILDGLQAGAAGYLLKDLSGSQLVAAIQTVASGGILFGAAVADRILQRITSTPRAGSPTSESVALSERERDVMRGVARGLSNAQIGQELFLAEGTVKNYVSSVLQKTGSKDRAEAAVKASRWGYLDG